MIEFNEDSTSSATLQQPLHTQGVISPQRKPLRWAIVAGLGICLGFLLLSRFAFSWFGADFKRWLTKVFDWAAKLKKNHFWAFGLIIIAVTAIDMLLLLPFYTPAYIFFAYQFETVSQSTAILTFTALAGSAITQLLLRNFSTTLVRIARSQPVLEIINRQSLTQAILLRFLYLPVGLKEYFFAAVGFGQKAQLISGLAYFGLHGLIYTLIAHSVSSLEDLYKWHGWQEKTLGEKAELCLAATLATATIASLVAAPLIASRHFRLHSGAIGSF